MNRLLKFEQLSSHAWLGRIYRKLNEQELLLARHFIREHDHLNAHEFSIKVNRMFIDRSKPKHFLEVMELLCCSNKFE